MKLKILLASVCILMSTTVFAELSVIESELSLTSTWRIEQAILRCDESHSELMYKDYWKDSVKPENRKTVCMAEQFADQVAADGDIWLEKKAENLIEQCKKQGRKNKKIYFLCLQKNLEQTTKILSVPCKELGEKKLWSEQKCERLVSYIFVKKFQKVLMSRKSPLERFKLALDRVSENKWLKLIINPVTAILFFILLVFDVIFLTNKGTLMWVTKAGFFLGPLLLFSCFTRGGMRMLSSGIVIVIILTLIGWNHRRHAVKPEKEEPTPIEL